MGKKNCLKGQLWRLAGGIAIATMLLVLGCSNGAVAPVDMRLTTISGPAGLPPVPLDLAPERGASAQQLSTQNGIDAWETSPGAFPFASLMRLSASEDALEYAIYKFSVGNNMLVSAKANFTIGSGENVWIGIANYQDMRWHFHGPFPESSLSSFTGLSDGGYVSAGGNAYLLVASYDATVATVLTVEFVTDDVTAPTYSISGTVTATADGAPLGGVLVSANPGNYQVETAADGTYSLDGVFAGDYTVTASLAGYSFAPASTNVTVGPDASGTDFSGTVDVSSYSMSGTVSNSVGGGGVPNVLLTIIPGGQTTTTNFSGTYAFTGLSPGFYTITPVLSGWTFGPSTQSASIGPSAFGLDFVATETIATFTISGSIGNSAGGQLSGVNVTLSPGGLSDTTDASGLYSISGVNAGTYTVTPSLADFDFAPLNQIVTVGPDKIGVDFTGTEQQVQVTYTADLKPIFDGHCLPCHSSNNHSGGKIFDNYTDAFNNAEAAATAVDQDIMPPNNNKLSPAEKALLHEWINTGKAL